MIASRYVPSWNKGSAAESSPMSGGPVVKNERHSVSTSPHDSVAHCRAVESARSGELETEELLAENEVTKEALREKW